MKNTPFTVLIILLSMFLILNSCTSTNVASEKEKFIAENLKFSEAQTQLMLKNVGQPTGDNYPRTAIDGKLKTTGMYDWTPGFFPGSLWYLYELSGDSLWLREAQKWTETLEPLKTFTGHHDLGFMMYCSYGNAERLASKPEYKAILIESANSLSSRYSDATKVIKSWNRKAAWDEGVMWDYSVIIDNMMNLEMLTYASRVSGDNRFKDIAVSHSNTTLKNHFREDFSTYHVVDYDTITGAVKYQGTNQGYSNNSTWARGQAWAIYGYTMMYRETKNADYLQAAIQATEFYLSHLPEDLIPEWDFNVGQEGYTPLGESQAVGYTQKPRDTSAAAVVSSALFELGKFADNQSYIDKAITMLQALASPAYRAPLGENGNFLIMHSVGSIPHGVEVDAPLVYTDYYFLEALLRYKNLE